MNEDSKKVALGKGWHNTGTTVASADYNTELEGRPWRGPDLSSLDTAGVPAVLRSHKEVLRVVVRNVGSFALTPKRLVSWASGYRGKRVDGYVRLPATGVVETGECAGAVDEHWPSSGVPVGELFNLVVRGPCLVTTDLAAGVGTVIAIGDYLIAATGATSGATTAGRAKLSDLTGATLRNNEPGYNLGRALSAKTTANTGANLLVDLTCWVG